MLYHRLCNYGAYLAVWIGMFGMSWASMIGGLVFGSIGFVGFVCGKRRHLWKMMLCGLALMILPYFVENIAILSAIGATGTAGLFFLRD